MKGTLQKTILDSHLACQPCAHFRDNDPDIFYCIQQRAEFPALCDAYQSRKPETNLQEKWVPA
jgi:hypothetical protein